MAGLEKILLLSYHAKQRMMLRNISDSDIVEVLESGAVIEYYKEDTPYPSCLMGKIVHGRPLHVVVAHDPQENRDIIVTVYEPEPALWSDGFTKRRVQ